jgi:hypothetical protein
MARQKITIGPNDYLAWGNLVKTWATGRNYVDHNSTETDPVPTAQDPKYPKPKSFAEFQQQCRDAGVGLFFDDGSFTPVPAGIEMGLIVLQGDSDVFILRVPPQEILLEHEARFLQAATYQFPGFYRDIYGGNPLPAQMATKVLRMNIHAERVGEYTLNTCG